MSEEAMAQGPSQKQEATPSPSDEIRVENLYKAFGDRCILDGISLEVCRGEMLAIVGGSGKGKSTLLKLIIGLAEPDQGRVLVADHESEGSPLVDLATLNADGMERLRRHWAVVFQGNALLAGRTVEENIALPLREVQHLDEATVQRKVNEAVRAVELDPGKDLNLTTDQLSGGMAKRVAIARCLAMDAILLLYDEPTTGLDPQVAIEIQDLIAAVHRRKPVSGIARTSFFITHDKEMLYRLAPRMMMLDAGRILFEGTYEAFTQSDSPVIRPYLEVMPELHQRLRE